MLAYRIFVYLTLQNRIKRLSRHRSGHSLSYLRKAFQPDHKAFSMMWQWNHWNRYDHLHLIFIIIL